MADSPTVLRGDVGFILQLAAAHTAHTTSNWFKLVGVPELNWSSNWSEIFVHSNVLILSEAELCVFIFSEQNAKNAYLYNLWGLSYEFIAYFYVCLDLSEDESELRTRQLWFELHYKKNMNIQSK